MKAAVLCLGFAFAATSLVAAEVVPGDSLEDALSALGSPRGRMQVGDRSLVYFERGEIEVHEGRVIRVDVKTPEEHASLIEREQRQRSERDVRRNQWITEGTAERDRRLADDNFRNAPLAYQVGYWQDFARRYPDVSVVEPLTIARMKYNAELEAKGQRDHEAQLQAEQLSAQDARPEVYPLYTGYPYYRRYRSYYSQGLGPFEYTFFPSPLPPYTTPSGNPAGNLRGPMINFPGTNPALPDRWEQPRWDRRWDRDRDDNRRGRRGRDDRS